MESRMKRSAGLLIGMLLISLPAIALAKPAVPSWRYSHPWSTEVATVHVGDQELQAEIADTSALQTRGLGYRDGLAPGTGMIFVFGEASMHTFWMKGMRFCLDIVWIEGGTVAGAAENACPEPRATDADLTRYSSGVPVQYVLEVPAGWMAIHGFGPGTPVQITLPGPPPG
jgi:uncharacterized membrane protein (UPF0127 family)